MNKFYFIALMVEVAIFIILIFFKKWDKRSIHYSLLFLLVAILVTHIFAFNNDCEDMYISLRYVRNFVEGKGLVFNNFDKVEGFSDFLWVMLIAATHKLLHLDIPIAARGLSLAFSVITLLYTYYLSFKFTGEKFISYMAAFLVAVNGSFACYGLAGLENPLFALFILMIINFTYENKWFLAGIFTALLTMTHPEGFIIYLPIAFYILITKNTAGEKWTAWFITALGALVLAIPWTLWRVSYYGYLIPNSVAAKNGMDIFFQIKIGLAYAGNFLFVNSDCLIVLFLLPIINAVFNKQKIKDFLSDKLLVLLLATSFVFILFYIWVGGDWMPGWRFFASMIPLFCIIMAVLWKNYIFRDKNYSVLKSASMIILFGYCAYGQIRLSFQSQYLIPIVREVKGGLAGLRFVGNWFHDYLPANTLLSTYPNGIFSYYNNLPTIDYGGLTDNNVGRFGNKAKSGRPGHIASNVRYILSKKPDIIAIMRGRGFEDSIYYYKPGADAKLNQFPGYVVATFSFTNFSTPTGRYINLNIRYDKKDEIIQYLLNAKNARLVKITDDYPHDDSKLKL